MAEVAVNLTDRLGEVSVLHVSGSLAGEGLEARRILRLVRFDCGGNVLIAKVQHRKREALLLAGDAAYNLDPAQCEPSPP